MDLTHLHHADIARHCALATVEPSRRKLRRPEDSVVERCYDDLYVDTSCGQSVVPTTPPHSSAEVMESMGLYLHAPQVPSWHVTGNSKKLVKKRMAKDTIQRRITIMTKWIIYPFQKSIQHSLHPEMSPIRIEAAFKFLSHKNSCTRHSLKVKRKRGWKKVCFTRVLYRFESPVDEHKRLGDRGASWLAGKRVYACPVLRKIFRAKWVEVTGEWRKLHNAELHALYSSRDIIRNIKSRRLRWAGHVARMGESRNAYRVLVGRPEGKRPLGIARRRWEDNIKMYLREVAYDDRDWINLAQDWDRWRAYVRAAMNLRVP
ncbi:hypothetical protein ANN_06292 [Periplaneta americana]|uniref:Uncharacterized protein n=1 Tax=Periplaneta americana TaxID=6978 RepID=A0ABQ8TF64_PERAM|nr:hypothetical protein ANN_06292 [Periplaneta americana]